MKRNILLVAPLHNVGGISSWTRKFLQAFPQDDYILFSVNQAPNRSVETGFYKRVFTGFFTLFQIMKDIGIVCHRNRIDLMHITTSGSIGSLRDYWAGRYCQKRGIKTILHCHYGCISEVLQKRSLTRWLTLLAMKQYDQIWVLDRKSYYILQNMKNLKAQIELTPNSIEVVSDVKIPPKKYKNVAFIGNLIPTKGLLELVQGIIDADTNIQLHIVGRGSERFLNRIKNLSNDLWGNRIKYYGQMENSDVIAFMEMIDTVILPTYYPSEAFPISILEAMSLGKLVISTRRAAIPDILAVDDDIECGLFVDERNSSQITEVLNWCLYNSLKADELCKKAYQKVYQSYRMEVVYSIYKRNYAKLLRRDVYI